MYMNPTLLLGGSFLFSHPLHGISVRTHGVRPGRIGIVCHASKLVAALTHHSDFSVRPDIDDRSALSDRVGGSRHRAFDDLLIGHLPRRHTVLLGNSGPATQ